MNDDAKELQKQYKNLMSGEVLRLILKKCGISQRSFADFLKQKQDETGIRMITRVRGVRRLITMRAVPDKYNKFLREFLGAQIYQKWYTYYLETRADEFYED